MKIVFVSVGTSLFERELLGPRESFRRLRDPAVLTAWDGPEPEGDASELSLREGEAKLAEALQAVDALGLDEGAGDRSLREVLAALPGRTATLREAFVTAGDEAEKELLSAELASLCRLLPRYPLGPGDRLVLLATDSPEGWLAGGVLERVLRDHPELGGAGVEAAWPRAWQPHDGARMTRHGAVHLLAAVSRRWGADLRACPLFVLTGGLKLGITVLTQVSCWSQASGHDGLFFKLQDPGGFFFPPCRFVDLASGSTLLPHRPTTEVVRGEVAYTDRLRGISEGMTPPDGGGAAPLTTLVVAVGVGLVRQRALLTARFGSSPLASSALWQEIDRHWRCTSWDELRAEMRSAPGQEELLAGIHDVERQLLAAWRAGRTRELPAELAALRCLWGSAGEPRPLLRGRLRVVLLATDSLTGEYCASLVHHFLRRVEGIAEVEVERVPGFHPFGGVSDHGDAFLRMAELVDAAAAGCERLLMVPLGGTKIHLPLLTLLATRLGAPVVLGQAGLERPVVVPWLERAAGRVRGATEGLATAWPELAGFPTVRLEVGDA